MEFVYKIRHKKSGLFFTKGTYNLGENARIYARKPNLSYLGHLIYVNQKVQNQLSLASNRLPIDKNDWEICQYLLVLHDTIQLEKKKPAEDVKTVTVYA